MSSKVQVTPKQALKAKKDMLKIDKSHAKT